MSHANRNGVVIGTARLPGVLGCSGILVLAALLRLWPIMSGPLVSHPDEVFLTLYPLNFLSGDLNPHSFHKPTFHFYLLGALYGLYFSLQSAFTATGLTLSQFVAYHYFVDAAPILLLARLTSVTFAVATVWWGGRLASEVAGPRAGWIAALLLAVGLLHVRQSPMAAVDVPMTLWVIGAVWAAARLLRRDRPHDYLLAALLVGLAGATKYPAAAAWLAIPAAHLLAGRAMADKRLWATVVVAAATFFLTSPYVLLDYETFATHFFFQTQHAYSGRGVSGSSAWYHLTTTLRYGLGWSGLALAAAATVRVVMNRDVKMGVVLISFAGLFAAVGWGQLAFMRYALPLTVLQGVLIAGLVASIRYQPLRLMIVLAAIAEPLYGSVEIARLRSRPDTRIEARTWIEAQVPETTPIANFGGWAGDVQLETFEHLWWKVSLFEKRFGRHEVDRAVAFLDDQPARPPIYSYGIQRTNLSAATGSFEEVERLETPIVVVHRHPLGYSQVDSTFADELQSRGTKVAQFSVQGLSDPGPVFDPVDAFYVPVGGMANLERPGPEIEIWQIPGCPVPADSVYSFRQLLSRAYIRGVTETLRRGGVEAAADLLSRARQLDEKNPEVYFVAAYFAQRAGATAKALTNYHRLLELNPANATAHNNLATLHASMGENALAEASLLEQLHVAPWKRSALQALAGFYKRQGALAKAAQCYTMLTSRFHGYAEDHVRLGLAHEDLGNAKAAQTEYLKALKIDAGNERVRRLLARLERSEHR